MDNGLPVCNVLTDCGFRTTKSVWPLASDSIPKVGGLMGDDPRYPEWVTSLQHRSFEIALHNATYHTSTPPFIVLAFEKFRQLFGNHPKLHANHTGCDDSIYWGDARLTGTRSPTCNRCISAANWLWRVPKIRERTYALNPELKGNVHSLAHNGWLALFAEAPLAIFAWLAFILVVGRRALA